MSILLPEARRIAALVPCYSPTGDSTSMITVDGQSVTVPLRIRTVVKRLALSHAADLAAIKKHAASATQRANLQPLPLTHGLVLCPIKVRTPRVTGDATIGYVNYYAVASVEKSPIIRTTAPST